MCGAGYGLDVLLPSLWLPTFFSGTSGTFNRPQFHFPYRWLRRSCLYTHWFPLLNVNWHVFMSIIVEWFPEAFCTAWNTGFWFHYTCCYLNQRSQSTLLFSTQLISILSLHKFHVCNTVSSLIRLAATRTRDPSLPFYFTQSWFLYDLCINSMFGSQTSAFNTLAATQTRHPSLPYYLAHSWFLCDRCINSLFRTHTSPFIRLAAT